MVYLLLFDILFSVHSSIILGTIGSYYVFSNVTAHIVLTYKPHGTLFVMPGKVFVQMYSNLDWETDLAEEQSTGEREVLGEEEGER